MLVGTPLAFIVLFCFHEAFFPLLDWHQSLLYAVMECVPVALLLAWATQNELRRRAARMEIRRVSPVTHKEKVSEEPDLSNAAGFGGSINDEGTPRQRHDSGGPHPPTAL